MEGLSFFVGVIGNIVSVLVFLSPIGTFWRVIKHRSTEEFESLPYICTLLNSSLWTYYGITKPGEILVATVNGFGIVVEAVYVTLFLIYAPKGMRAKTAILVGILDVGLLAVAIAVTQLAMNRDVRIDAIGFMGAALNIIMYASPLAAMVPNGTGFILGIAQLVLYAIYRNAKPTRNTTFDVLEEGCSQHEHLIPSSHQFIS
ncbi:bidirectional sugar transporter SWEET17-like isoform X2 [Camellia sinensis]|uniref:bidirectional sugar transporter SWEET17-like isoform X2 n=1 Tax=Camellia sinensis TaxID=4442 RepID=UPI001036D26A|nr:bidirectional sugar transporter SWEET17-like isoform X2 [Camellia sinensis]